MNFLVSIETAGKGSYTLGTIAASSQKEAQDIVAEKIISAGIPQHKVSKQVSDRTTIHVGTNTVVIVPVSEFSEKQAIIIATLIST